MHILVVVNMPLSDDELNSMKEAEKRKEEEKAKEKVKAKEKAKNEANQLKKQVLTILQTKKNEQTPWMKFREIVEQALGRNINAYKPQVLPHHKGKFEQSVEQIEEYLKALLKEGKIKTNTMNGETYYSAV